MGWNIFSLKEISENDSLIIKVQAKQSDSKWSFPMVGFTNLRARKINVRGNNIFYLLKKNRNKVIWLLTWKKRSAFAMATSLYFKKVKINIYFRIFCADLKNPYGKNRKEPDGSGAGQL